jgi:hypothetical protein
LQLNIHDAVVETKVVEYPKKHSHAGYQTWAMVVKTADLNH